MNDYFLDFLTKIKVRQENDKQEIRLNPKNPLTYFFLFFLIIISLFMFGYSAFKEVPEIFKPFKYR